MFRVCGFLEGFGILGFRVSGLRGMQREGYHRHGRLFDHESSLAAGFSLCADDMATSSYHLHGPPFRPLHAGRRQSRGAFRFFFGFLQKLRGRERLGLGQHLLVGLKPRPSLLLVAPGTGLGRLRLCGFGRGRKAPNLSSGVKQTLSPWNPVN